MSERVTQHTIVYDLRTLTNETLRQGEAQVEAYCFVKVITCPLQCFRRRVEWTSLTRQLVGPNVAGLSNGLPDGQAALSLV